jgi:hypothetical protein
LKQGEEISNLENASKSYSFTFDHLQKDFEKDLQKICKKKTKCVVQAWSKMLKIKKQSMHIL